MNTRTGPEPRAVEPLAPTDVDDLGALPLEGSGFENETPVELEGDAEA